MIFPEPRKASFFKGSYQIKQNYEEAFRLFNLAFKKNCKKSSFYLGKCYHEGNDSQNALL